MLGFVIGFVLGSICGVFGICLAMMAGRSEDDE